MKDDFDYTFDAKHIWHPYTSMIDPLPCYAVAHCQDVRLTFADGRTVIDGMSSWWSAIHGYNHPVLNQAASTQLSRMSHVMFGGLTHQPAVSLCKSLLAMTPEPLQKIFLCDSGSIAVEVAIKMALQYWHSRQEQRTRLMTITRGYHGDTFAAMSVTDPNNAMHSMYRNFLPQHIFAQAPHITYDGTWQADDFNDFNTKFMSHHHTIAAVILEPIVQGAGGMHFYHPEFLKNVRRLCDETGVLLIADEIATGFGRTGRMFACEHADIVADILCVGKALTGGYMTLAATLTTHEIAETVCSEPPYCFMHGPTFMANPLACAVAHASLSLLATGQWYQQVNRIHAQLARDLPPLLQFDAVADVRCLGAIGVIEMKKPVDVKKAQAVFIARGVWIRPFGRLIYIMPPYIITPEQLSQLVAAIAYYAQLVSSRHDCLTRMDSF